MAQTCSDTQASMKRYYNQDTFSDAVLQCNGQEFKVHKIVLAAHSPFFAAMLTGPWKESTESIIKLDDIEITIIEAVLHFMYDLDYTCAHDVSSMVFNAQVYSAAERYNVPALKTHARTKFRQSINSGWSEDDFSLAINEVYQSTVHDDRGLRDLVVEVSHKHINDLLGREGFSEALRSVPAFAAELIPFVSVGQQVEYVCPTCSFVFSCKMSEGSITYHCPFCGKQRMDWKAHRVGK